MLHNPWPSAITPVKSPAAVARDLFTFFAKSRIAYCVVGDARRLPEEIEGDIDVVMDMPSLAHVSQVLAAYCRQNGVEILQYWKHETRAALYLLSWHTGQERREYLFADVYLQIVRGGRVFFSAAEFVHGRRQTADSTGTLRQLYVPAPDKAFIYYLIKKVDKGRLDDRQAAYLNHEYGADPDGADLLIEQFWSARSTRLLAHAARSGQWDAVRERLPELRRELHRKVPRPWSAPAATLMRKVRQLNEPTGLFVVLHGSNSCTWVAQNLARERLPAIRRIRHQVGSRKGRSDTVPPPPRAIAWAGVACRAALDRLRYLCFIRVHLARSTLVVSHRNCMDTPVVARPTCDGESMAILRWIERIVPRPDLVISLRVSEPRPSGPDETRTRAHERGGEYLVDITQPPAEIVFEVEEAILQRIATRTKERLGT